ncbi:MAG: hypothetical protein ACP5M3_06075 [Acidithiobacillus sp.]
MGTSTALTIIAVCMLLILLILAVTTGVVVRTFLRLERVLARVEQDLSPALFELKTAVHQVQHLIKLGGRQVERVDASLRYVDRELRETVDTLVLPVREIGLWYRALRVGLRYFFRRR